MSNSGVAMAAAAESLIGTRFRLGGREPSTGLDCIGLVVACLEMIGRQVGPLPTYSVRRTEIGTFLKLADGLGLVAAKGASCAGDVALLHPSPQQSHLAICGGNQTFIHAHAGLRRVTRGFEPFRWPVEQRWRID